MKNKSKNLTIQKTDKGAKSLKKGMVVTLKLRLSDVDDVNSEQAEHLVDFFQEECTELIDKYKDLGDHNASCVEAWVDDVRGCVY